MNKAATKKTPKAGRRPDGKFRPGMSGNPNGRPKGSKNKFTDLKNTFLEAFEKTGGVPALVKWVKQSSRNRGLFYQILAKMLPSNVTVGDHKDLKYEIIFKDDDDDGAKQESPDLPAN